jgi:uncharacterized protein YhfF
VIHPASSPVAFYWAQYLASLPDGSDRPAEYYEAFHFGSSEESCDLITPLVLNGTKTATGSLLWVYEEEGRRPPEAGDYSIVTDAEGGPVCVILDTEIRNIPYDEVDRAFASDGGEEDRTLESWRQIYWEYIISECARIQREPSHKTPLVCERFRVVYKEPPKRKKQDGLIKTAGDILPPAVFVMPSVIAYECPFTPPASSSASP